MSNELQALEVYIECLEEKGLLALNEVNSKKVRACVVNFCMHIESYLPKNAKAFLQAALDYNDHLINLDDLTSYRVKAWQAHDQENNPTLKNAWRAIVCALYEFKHNYEYYDSLIYAYDFCMLSTEKDLNDEFLAIAQQVFGMCEEYE